MAYKLEGRLLEVCDCNVLCPCWIGEDPDNGTCDAVLAYHIDRGTVDGVDVSGLTVAALGFIPGNILQGNIKGVFFVDSKATAAQAEGIRKAWGGALGGPLGDLAKLYSDVRWESAPISFSVREGHGSLTVGSVVTAEMDPYRGPTGAVTSLNESVFSTIPGSPAYVSKATRYTRKSAEYGLRNVELSGRNAIQGEFHFAA